jgi:hypothetical protein
MEDFTLQLSIKIDGVHLFNIRASDPAEFWALVGNAVEHAELIQSAARALEGVQKPEPVRPVSHTGPRSGGAPGATSAEIGPVAIKGVEKALLKKDGTPMKSPRFVVKFSNGRALSTFDEAIAASAETLAGQQVYYATEKRGEYENLASVRRAS